MMILLKNGIMSQGKINHKSKPLLIDGSVCDIDEKIYSLIRELNNAGLKTLTCCQGDEHLQKPQPSFICIKGDTAYSPCTGITSPERMISFKKDNVRIEEDETHFTIRWIPPNADMEVLKFLKSDNYLIK